jgi:hypothetical protein
VFQVHFSPSKLRLGVGRFYFGLAVRQPQIQQQLAHAVSVVVDYLEKRNT